MHVESVPPLLFPSLGPGESPVSTLFTFEPTLSAPGQVGSLGNSLPLLLLREPCSLRSCQLGEDAPGMNLGGELGPPALSGGLLKVHPQVYHVRAKDSPAQSSPFGVVPFIRCEMRLREAEWLAQGQTASKWPRGVSELSGPDSVPIFLNQLMEKRVGRGRTVTPGP